MREKLVRELVEESGAHASHPSLQTQLVGVHEYRDAKDRFVAAVKQGAEATMLDEIYEGVRGVPAKTMAKGIALAHVPDAVKTLLYIRRAEKDYDSWQPEISRSCSWLY